MMYQNRVFKSTFWGWVLFFAITIVGLFGSSTYAIDERYYYYSDGQKIELNLSTSQIALRFKEGQWKHFTENTPAILNEATSKYLETSQIYIFNYSKPVKKNDVQSFIQSLNADPSVEFVALTFSQGSTDMIVTDEFIAQFASSLNNVNINALVGRFQLEIKAPIEGLSNTYIIKCFGENALEMANLFHQMDEVTYAHPNFLRIRQTPEILDPNQSYIWGPDGRRYYGEMEALKGTNAYRRVGPAKAVLSIDQNGAAGPCSDVTKNTIKEETFEGSFPNAWSLYGDPTWGETSYRAYTDSYSGYCVGSSVSPPGPYPNDANSWMVYGPFSLVGAEDARLDLQAWVNTESGYDYFYIFASTDGTNYYGSGWSGDWASYIGGWMNIAFDLKNVNTLGDLRGEPEVWIAIRFVSDSTIFYEGVYVDNVVIEMITGGYTNLTSDVYDHLQWSLNNTGQLWGTSGADIEAVNAWNISQGSSSTVIAIIDEGVDLTHPDLVGKLVSGYDATGSGSGGGPSGDDAHGTNCAGIAAAVTENAAGVAGIAPLAKIMPIRIAKDDGSGSWLTSDAWIADGINWAVSNGADVLSNSWGGGSPSTVITSAIQNAKNNGRGGKGCFVAFASGNDNGAVSYPATLSEVMAVGALSPCDERKAPTSCDGEYWWGGNYGSELDISAPGVHMYSTDISGSSGYSSGDYYYNFNGTSSACPVVAGVAGLLIGTFPYLTALEVEQILQNSADDLGDTGWDSIFGYGRVNAYRALKYNDVSSSSTIIPAIELLLLSGEDL